MSQTIISTRTLAADLDRKVGSGVYDRVFVLTDDNTHRLCLPLLMESRVVQEAKRIQILSGEENKTLDSLQHVWRSLSEGGASRCSCLVCLGGGLVTDLGGFAAATFKRGIDFYNIPTTLLAMVDASVGGKTGVNFCGLKNEVGVFAESQAVLLSTQFLTTLDSEHMLSGYGEMLKHALLSNPTMLADVLRFDILRPDFESLQTMVMESIGVKQRVVEADPTEQGIRKVLNLGHTVGHAVESLLVSRGTPIAHGHAVAVGLVCALYLSVVKTKFPMQCMRYVTNFIRENYPTVGITCDDYEELLRLMLHDKKNVSGKMLFTLLADVGRPLINQQVGAEEITESLDFYREG